MSRFLECLKAVVNEEGGLSLDPEDNGNWTGGRKGVGELRGTAFGISAAAYPTLDIRSLTLGEARELYLRDYWTPLRADSLPLAWQLPVFDMAVNQGVVAAIKTMQDAVGVMVDGRLGPRTMGAVQAADNRKLARFFALRTLRYVEAPTFRVHGYGWLTRAFVMAMESN